MSIDEDLQQLVTGATGHAVLGLVIVTDTLRPGDVAEITIDRASGAVRARRWPGLNGSGVLPETWSCMVCGDDRPDPLIAVAHRKVAGLEQLFPDTRVNVRYCTDRPGCVEKAAGSDSSWHPGQLGGGRDE